MKNFIVIQLTKLHDFAIAEKHNSIKVWFPIIQSSEQSVEEKKII